LTCGQERPIIHEALTGRCRGRNAIRLITMNRPVPDRVRVTPGFVPLEHDGAEWLTNHPAPLHFMGFA
jgi:hypothetical protein